VENRLTAFRKEDKTALTLRGLRYDWNLRAVIAVSGCLFSGTGPDPIRHCLAESIAVSLIVSRHCSSCFRSIAVVLVIALAATTSGWCADHVMSIQKLNDSKPWERFVDAPLATTIEGRVGVSGGGLLRFLKCDLRFKVDSTRLKLIGSKENVEVKGHFKKEGSRVEFVVDELRTMSSYADQFDFQAAKLKRPTAEEWTELGNWIGERGKFYEDPELLQKANDAYLSAIDVQYRALKSTDSEGRLRLAKKVEEQNLSPRRQMDLIHEALRIQWQGLQKTEPADIASWTKFAEQLASQFSGADQPIKSVPQNLKDSYDQDPVGTYRKATDDVRKTLHRLFYVAVIRKRLLNGASIDGRDGESIADQIEKLIPEEQALAEKQRLAGLPYRLANIRSANRAEAESLAAAYRARGENDNALMALTQWVKSHELQLKKDGVVGLVQLADEYLTLLKNEPVAIEYLLDAHRLDPKFDEVHQKLTSLGYSLQGGQWRKSAALPRDVAKTAPQNAMGIREGQTATELRNQLGQPPSLARAITSRGITEIWSFGSPGSTRLVVRLEQRGRDPEPKVTAYSNLR